MKKLLYFAYFIKSTDRKKLNDQLAYSSKQYSCSKIHLCCDMLCCALKYGISFHEYFYYGFCQKDKKQRLEYASMAFMYEFQKKYNSKDHVDILNDKLLFNKTYAEFVNRKWLNPIASDLSDIQNILLNSDKVVLKRSKGTIGKDVLVLDVHEMTPEQVKKYAIENDYNLLEEFVYQHLDMQKISPNSLNTIRIITHLNEDNSVDILGAILRMGTTKNTDNFSTGGIAAKIDITDGIVISDGVMVDISEPVYKCHPVSGAQIKGFKIPFWENVLAMTRNAAKKADFNKTVGWDVAVKEDGPIMIEGNHNWWAGIWQMVEGKGMKYVLNKYL